MPTATKCNSFSRKEGDHQNDVLLSWLKIVFEKKEVDFDWIPTTKEQTIMRVRGYILHFIGKFLFPNTSKNKVALEHLPLLEDLNQTTQYRLHLVVSSYLFSGLCKVVASGRSNATGYAVLLNVYLIWEHFQLMILIILTHLSY